MGEMGAVGETQKNRIKGEIWEKVGCDIWEKWVRWAQKQKYLCEEELLGPRDAVHRKLRVVPDRTDRVALLRRHRIALEAFRPALDDGAHLSHVAARARLD